MRPLVLAIALAAAGPIAAEAPREIVVTGEGRVEVPPDMAIVRAGVETRAEAAADALAANADAMRAVIEALAGRGILPTDMQTSQLLLEPIHRQRDTGEWTNEIEGYRARNTVTVRVREAGAVGGVIDTMSEAGINRIDGISFGIAEPRPHLDEARADAVADARAKAARFATAAGVALGPVLGIRETQPFDRPMPAMRMEMAMDGAIAEGALELTAMVEIVYAIEDDSSENDASEDGAND